MISDTVVISVKALTVRRDRTSAQIAQEFGLAAPTVQKYAREGRVPYDVTPGGHRRFNLDEVRAALYDSSPSLRDAPLVLDGGLGAGRPVAYSTAAAAERDTRTLVATAHEDEAATPTALQELFAHARRVLVTTGG